MDYGGALPPALPGDQGTAFEFLQASALRSLIGNAVDHAVWLKIAVVLEVFGMLKMTERRLVARVRLRLLSLVVVAAARSEAQTGLGRQNQHALHQPGGAREVGRGGRAVDWRYTGDAGNETLAGPPRRRDFESARPTGNARGGGD